MPRPISSTPEAFFNQQRRDKDGLPDAVKYYEAALLLDPGYVDAWGGLSRALAVQGVFGTRPAAEVFPRAKEAALKAVQLDPESAEAHAALAHVLVVYDRNYKLADEHYAIAKRLDPAVPEFYLLSSLNKACLGHMDRSLQRSPACTRARAGQPAVPFEPRHAAVPEAKLRRGRARIAACNRVAAAFRSRA